MLRDMIRITCRKTDITYTGDGKTNQYFLLRVFGMKSEEAYKLAYKEE